MSDETLIADLVRAGVDPNLVGRVANAIADAASGNSTGIPVDVSAEKRRAYDRERKRIAAEIRRNSTGTPRNSEKALSLTSSLDSENPKEGRKKERARKHSLPPEFQPKPSHFDAADRLGVPHSFVQEKTEDMRLWAQSSGALKMDWDATLHGFIRRDAGKFKTGFSNSRPQKKTVHEAADDLLARVRSFDAGPDDVRNRAGETVVRRLPAR